MPEAEEGGLLASKQVVDFIEKPFTIRRMINAIEKAICCFQILNVSRI